MCMCTAVQAACTLAHLLGLFRLDPGESLLSLGYRGALADVLLWGFTRIQTHMFASDTYDRSACLAWLCWESAAVRAVAAAAAGPFG